MDWKERLQNLVDYQSIPFWSWNDNWNPKSCAARFAP